MMNYYLNSLLQKFMWIMTDHFSQIKCFEICCTDIISLNILLFMIWSQLNIWKNCFEFQKNQINDLAAADMTSLLLYLYKIILQNSVTLYQYFSNHFIWNHSVFQHETYVIFLWKIEVCQNVKMMSNQLSIFYQMMPQLADQLQFLNAWNEQQVKKLQISIEQHSTQSQQQLQQLLAFSILTFQFELLSASQLIFAQINIAAISQLQHSSSSSLQSSNRLESESSRYQMCYTVKTVKTFWCE